MSTDNNKSKYVFTSKNLSLQLTRDPQYTDQVVGGKVVRVLQSQQPIAFENGRYQTKDDDKAEWLRSHRLFGTYFEELPSEVVQDAKKNDKPDAADVNDLSIPETKQYIEDHDLSDADIVAFAQGDKEGRAGITGIREAAQRRIDEPGEPQSDSVVKDDITNINQLKDYLESQPGVDGRTLTTKDKILAAAKQLDPPHEFPNLNTGG